MTGERSSAKAAWLGACWGLGHTLTLLATGALLVMLRAEMPAIAAQVFELCVVLLLVGFGVRAIYQGARRRVRRSDAYPRKTRSVSPFHIGRWTLARPLLVGAVHGLAGSGALTALVVTTLPSTATRLGYLALFGVGSTVGMAALSGLLGWPIARLGAHHVFVRSALAGRRLCLDRARSVLGLSAHRRVVLTCMTLRALCLPLRLCVSWRPPPLSARLCQRSRSSPPEEPSRAVRIRSRAAMCRLSPPTDLIAAVPAIRTVARIETQEISNISSSDMTPQLWLQLSTRINELLSRSGIAGAVVTHGTNTLEETAYFLDLTITSSKPVVVVGAQRPASDRDADGPRNLLDAIRVATSPEAAGKGVMVVMNGQINAARDVTKTNTSQVETFRSLEFGALGVVDVEAVRFYRSPLRRQTLTLIREPRSPASRSSRPMPARTGARFDR